MCRFHHAPVQQFGCPHVFSVHGARARGFLPLGVHATRTVAISELGSESLLQVFFCKVLWLFDCVHVSKNQGRGACFLIEAGVVQLEV